MIALTKLPEDLARARASAIWPIEAWLYTLQIVPFAIFVLGVRASIRSAGQEALADVFALSGILFMSLHTLHNLAIVTAVQVLAAAYVPGTAEGTAIEAVARGLLGFAYAAFVPGGGVGTALLVAMLAAFTAAQGETRALPRWSGRLSAAGAALLAVGYAQYLVPAAFFVALLGVVIYIAWTIVVTVGLARPLEARSAVFAPQPA
ncbi:MAG: hypothetical protein ACRDG6_03885 [Candidatus Limnocylindria bacterium]